MPICRPLAVVPLTPRSDPLAPRSPWPFLHRSHLEKSKLDLTANGAARQPPPSGAVAASARSCTLRSPAGHPTRRHDIENGTPPGPEPGLCSTARPAGVADDGEAIVGCQPYTRVRWRWDPAGCGWRGPGGRRLKRGVEGQDAVAGGRTRVESSTRNGNRNGFAKLSGAGKHVEHRRAFSAHLEARSIGQGLGSWQRA